MSAGTLNISEIFHSIQGESSFSGSQIYNTNRDSAITQFPFMDLDEALRSSPCYQEDAVPQMSLA